MNKATSIYLDLVRFLAAIVVFSYHANKDRFTGGLPGLSHISHLSNDAVMVFFVLSGFVIAYVANTKENKISKYFINRFARLYSVVIPALIFTVIFDFLGSQIAYQPYDTWRYQTDQPFIRFFANLFFVNQLWFTSIRPFSNSPFWSIGYEFWYYVLFALVFYLKKPIKWILVILVCLFIGPKILILMPVWLMGVVVYKIVSLNKLSESLGWVLFLVSIICYLEYRMNSIGQNYVLEYTKYVLGANLYSNLRLAKLFLSDYIIGILISLNFIGFYFISNRFEKILLFCKKPIQYMASYTFVLYLLHFPLLYFFAALTYDSETAKTQPIIVVVGTLLTIWLLGRVTEKQKNNYKHIFSLLWQHFQGILAKVIRIKN